MGLMAMADMVVAHERAIFGLPEVKVGVFPAQVLAVLSGLIPQRILSEMVITGEPLTAAEAHEGTSSGESFGSGEGEGLTGARPFRGRAWSRAGV